MRHPCCLRLTALATLAPPHFPLPRQTVEVVEELVRSYKGVLLVVSHGEGARCTWTMSIAVAARLSTGHCP